MNVSISRRKVPTTEIERINNSTKIFNDKTALRIEHAVEYDGYAILSGWTFGDIRLRINDTIGRFVIDRPDVVHIMGETAKGFSFVILLDENAPSDLALEILIGSEAFRTPVRLNTGLRQANSALIANGDIWPELFELVGRSLQWRRLFASHEQDVTAKGLNAILEAAVAYGDSGVMAVGWAHGNAEYRFWLASEHAWRSLETVSRYARQDVYDALKGEMNLSSDNLGFFASLTGSFTHGDEIGLVAIGKGKFSFIAKTNVVRGVPDPKEASAHMFAIPTPIQEFAKRVASDDMVLLEDLLKARASGWADIMVTERPFGIEPKAPEISVIVPLYGRSDLMEHQLAKFSKDADFTEGRVELLYVVDDPALFRSTLDSGDLLYSLYNVPFKVIWGGVNRGYSGANNLGAAHARGRTFVMLNSDVFPSQPGWATRLAALLEANPDFGVITPRLVFADGSLQHVGINFAYDQKFRIWINNHLLAGLPVTADSSTELVERPAVTGACMVVKAADFRAVGGFDTGYLIGDFEDSDFCMKMRARGKKPGYWPGETLTHLERQSFRMIDGNEYRQKVVIYNAQRHFARWEKQIVDLTAA